MRFPPRHQLEGGLDVRVRRLDDGLCCLTEDAAVQLHRGDVVSSQGHHCREAAGIRL